MQRHRLHAGLTQQQAADRLFMSKSAYQKYEMRALQATYPQCDYGIFMLTPRSVGLAPS
ncbi:helix-turn-helix transcriptional regulator [Nocardia uniformis]|uniref:Helix-turn-helix transcriptional regulator n=1 Tax=Nocardia uniformis TaxID=53432 RepID=A0A849C5S8_9NOCA|nr:helix-turn-helix transcriptional regulator [Nocardia uniformis]NNH71770.1 helix-turn-helix transcriptional regulator [Nocardia uniformis]